MVYKQYLVVFIHSMRLQTFQLTCEVLRGGGLMTKKMCFFLEEIHFISKNASW